MSISNSNKIFVGSMLKKIRKNHNITLEDLSKKSGLSKTYINQIENNKHTNPSISTLKKIADAMNVPIMAIIDENYHEKVFNVNEHEKPEVSDWGKDVFIVRKNKRKVMKYPDSDWEIELLSPDLDKKIELILTAAKPGQFSGEEPFAHEGEEVGVVLEGKLKFTVNSIEYILNEGDSICFNSSLPHKWEVIGDTVSKTIWAITPPSF